MYNLITGITLLKQIRPFFHKYILRTLNAHEYLFINSIIIFIVILVYLGYMFFVEHISLGETVDKCCKLSYFQIIGMIMLSIITMASTMLFFDFDKHYNTPLINAMYFYGVSIIILLLIGVFGFNEKYNWKQLCGIIVIMFGIYLIT